MNFPDKFSKNTKISYIIKIRPFHADGQMGGQKYERTDLSKLILAFRDFVKDRKLLLSATSSFPAVGPCLQIKDRTARLKVMNQSLASDIPESKQH